MKKIIIVLLVLLLGVAAYFLFNKVAFFPKPTNETLSNQPAGDSLKPNIEASAIPVPEPETPIEAEPSNVEEGKKNVQLTAYGFNSTGLRSKLNNTTEPTTKAKNCVQIRSTFTIADNSVATPGERTVYMQVINPEGTILQSRSSSTTTDAKGESFAYSDKKSTLYNNQAIELSIYYDFNGQEPLKGDYKVHIFCDGYVIGSDSFNLK